MHDQYSKLSELVIGCAFEVHNELGFGFLESVYEKSLIIALSEKGIACEQQVPIEVYFRGKIVGNYIVDLLVENKLLVELKSVRELSPPHEIQLVNYLTAMRFPTGLLLNFGPASVQVKRKFNNSSSSC